MRDPEPQRRDQREFAEVGATCLACHARRPRRSLNIIRPCFCFSLVLCYNVSARLRFLWCYLANRTLRGPRLMIKGETIMLIPAAYASLRRPCYWLRLGRLPL